MCLLSKQTPLLLPPRILSYLIPASPQQISDSIKPEHYRSDNTHTHTQIRNNPLNYTNTVYCTDPDKTALSDKRLSNGSRHHGAAALHGNVRESSPASCVPPESTRGNRTKKLQFKLPDTEIRLRQGNWSSENFFPFLFSHDIFVRGLENESSL